MIEIKPNLHFESDCPYCCGKLEAKEVVWQGFQICIRAVCLSCNSEIFEGLQCGFTRTRKHQADLKRQKEFGDEQFNNLLVSLSNPCEDSLKITKEVFFESKKVIILNCIDFAYGHCLLKLLNAQRHLEIHSELSLVVIIQKPFRWLVPSDVAEVWTADIPLKKGQEFFPTFNEFVSHEIKRFEIVKVSEAFVHPSKFDISFFTTVPKHDFSQPTVNITFIWREDRLWVPFESARLTHILSKINLLKLALRVQNWLIVKLFKEIKKWLPDVNFSVTGLGVQTQFPSWISDNRVEKFDKLAELSTCKICSSSRLVIGVHGSNLLLPSGHAGMTIELVQDYKWGQRCSAILYQESDPRLAAFRYQYLPINIDVKKLATIAVDMIKIWPQFYLEMSNTSIGGEL